MTRWLKNQQYPTSFAIEKACMLQDPKQEGRIIRCKEQNLFDDGIQSLIKDGCEAVQLALSWQDRVEFVLTNDFSLTSIQFADEIIAQVKELEAETDQQRFHADFVIMAGVFQALLTELLDLFDAGNNKLAA
jgi:recombination associated protein RdgC